jgi:hypothetical protein
MQYTLVEKLMEQSVDTEVFVMNQQRAAIHSFNETGGFLWKLVSSKKTFEEIVDALCKEYDIVKEEAEKDVTEYLQELEKQGLINYV